MKHQKTIVFLGLIFLTISLFAQKKESVKLDVNFYRLAAVENFNIPKSDANGETVFIKCHLKSLNKNHTPIDVNAFSLVDKKNKKRYRLIDFYAFKNTLIFVSGSQNGRLLKTNILKDSLISLKPYAEYNPSIKDSFENYSIKGYENREYNILFNCKEEKDTLKSAVYFKPITYKKSTAYLYFMVDPSTKPIRYYLYHKNKKISSIYFK